MLPVLLLALPLFPARPLSVSCGPGSPLGATAVPAAEEPPDLATALAWLDADDPGRRALGERWLGRHLAARDLDVVRAALASGSWEVALRLRTALASAPRAFDLAARLAVGAEPRARSIGEGALVERLARWTGGWERPLDDRGTVVGALLGEFGLVLALEPGAGVRSLRQATAALVEHAGNVPRIVVQPGLELPEIPRSPDSRERAGELTGTFDALVVQLARAHELSIAGLGFADDLDGRAARCIVLRSQRDETDPTGHELVLEWVRAAAGAELRAARRAAVRALAATGWPDAVAWMEDRWLADAPRDGLWLDGLCAARDRGVLAPRLCTAPEVERLHAYLADPALEPEPELRAERLAAVARLLAAIGPRDAAGADLRRHADLPADEDADVLTWARLVVQEGFGALATEQAAALDRRIASLGADARPRRAPLLLQALRTRAALVTGVSGGSVVSGQDGPELARPEALLEDAERAGRLAALARTLHRARVRAPARWAAPTALPRDWPFALRLEAVVWLARSRPETGVLVRHLAALAEGAQDADILLLARRLRAIARAEEGAAFVGALAGVELATLRELHVALGPVPRVAGAPPPASSTTTSGPIRDLAHALALGARTAAGDLGDAGARSVLLAALATADDDRASELAFHGLDWAVEAARARMDEELERELVQSVRRAARDAPPAVRGRIRADLWPAALPPEPIDIADLARELPAGWR